MNLKNYAFFLCLILSFSNSAQSQNLKAVNDTIDLIPGIPKMINLLDNDTIPNGDSIKIVGANPAGNALITTLNSYRGIFTYLVRPLWGFNGSVSTIYTIIDLTIGKTSSAKILFRIHDHSYDSLDINNVKAAITAYANEFYYPAVAWSGQGNLFRIPANSLTGTIYNFAPWIGGKDADSTLFQAAERYMQGPNSGPAGYCPDFYAGPVMDSVNYSIYQDTLWNRVWKVRKTEVEFHKTHWDTPGYHPPTAILTWPGNGIPTYGQAAQLAPYHDSNGDGKYVAADGDYPVIQGDEAIFAIFNDDRGSHKETLGKKMRLEFQVMAYAYDMPEDSAFKNTIFLNYKIINRSARTYYQTYLGVFSDMDIGSGTDDYIGCDVERNSYFGYNGVPVDGTGQPSAYGAHPPAQSVTILNGPLMDATGDDRPRFDLSGHQLCNESVNGTGFGDNIPDNEHYGMTNFMALYNVFSGFMSDPNYAVDYYQRMQSVWKDSTHLIYGGGGHPATNGYGPECRFMFPGESDSVNWGTGCTLPNGPVNWTTKTGSISSGDIRGIAAMGPFTFRPGDVRQLDLAFVYARDYTGQDTAYPSVDKLRQMIDIVRNSYNTGVLPNGNSFFGMNEKGSETVSIKIYPNPATEKINVQFEKNITEKLGIRIINSTGIEVYSGVVNPSGKTITLDVHGLSPGVDVIIVRGREFSSTGKVVIIK